MPHVLLVDDEEPLRVIPCHTSGHCLSNLYKRDISEGYTQQLAGRYEK
ncbi:hypothetical protein NUACC26_089660 [Scytonema sp. NUACC26]